MSRRRVIWIVPERNIILIKGWRAGELLRDGGFRPTFSGSVGAWMLDAARLPDVVAWFSYRNVAVHVHEVTGGDAG